MRLASLSGKTHRRLPDGELIARCLAGEETAWDALIERYAALINTVTIRMGLSSADGADVFQEVCLQLYNHLPDLRDTTRLASWLITITRREAWRLRRCRGPQPLSELAEQTAAHAEPLLGETPPPPEDTLLALDRTHRMYQAMQLLPERCRSLLELLFYHDPPCSYAEINARLGIAPNSIGSARARCLEKLRKILEKELL